ncbi:FAD/NAD(P)-binding domain-containing protein [Hortaea werneckii]|uniref:FAD-binding domain-containing protein n=1 Tax=Hortaea werneckii TaxID=91943 RepID=A0A3M7BZQ0_HORWE|nr:FAD/NAD(P)-binding domain-containing protein [Hortaea werneckii]KAI7063086.1 FAD/NAD(P)-binding domain-containing protein [Hortaea werneckii]KAI7199551.1 FAD/NAD(P)-binding domain-containing protein [Hortaea werneckii]KAI7215826.1 FAD/NAD(P)-binding domain-containing protein [Hortaea werneckii]KAI7289447.1 FAD/NAD(P)-binding domain-containing protein [Hortaea werneckii]
MAPASPDGLRVIILGGGISGLTTALALTKYAPKGQVPKIDIFEIRPEPATIGGAVNLTPNALRMLDHLGALPIIRERDYGRTIDYLEVFDIYSGKLAESSFQGPEGKGIGNPPYKALRITRGDALKGVLEAVNRQENITMTCGRRTVSIDEKEDGVTLQFEDGGSASGELLMGCDGIHSVTRLKHVEPERKATYSGVANAFGFAPIDKDFKVHFECTAINFARRGMLLTSYHSSKGDSVYVGGLMQVPDVGSRDGWKSVGADADKTRGQLMERFGDAKIPCIKPLIEKAQDFFLWPVYTLSKHGKWSTNRVMLLGDAAHAMPPQGESTGIVFEDTVLFSRCLTKWLEKGRPGGNMREAFDAYEKLRKHRIEVAFEESKSVVSTVSDAGWLGHTIKTYVVPWYLWFTRSYREKHFIEDVTTVDIGY